MVVQSYTECFWGGELKSKDGYQALVQRNHDGKKMCQELEEYLKKRAKLEFEFSKSLSNLTKCFKHRESSGVLEAAINSFRQELEAIASSHHGSGVFFNKQADSVKSFKDDQTAKAKQAEDQLDRTQNAKISQLSKTNQLEKTYVKKSRDRDTAGATLRDVERECGLQDKEFDKVRQKYDKAEDEAQKADTAYKSAVISLENATKDWENAMVSTCQIVQNLDEKRIHYVRGELWLALNVDSKTALDTDNCCENVRKTLEKCDVSSDAQAFLNAAATGATRPKHYTFKTYNSLTKEADSDADSTTSSTDNSEDGRGNGNKNGHALKGKATFFKFKPQSKH